MFKRLICLVILLTSVVTSSVAVAEDGFGRFGQSADSYLREQKRRRAAGASKFKSPSREKQEARRTHGGMLESRWLMILVFLVACAILVGCALYGVYSSVKGPLAARKYDAKNRNRYSCSYCGRTYGTHAVYHSVSKTKNLGRWDVQVDRGGFAIYTCRTCLLRHRLRYALWWSAARIMCLVGICVCGCLVPSCEYLYGCTETFHIYLCLFYLCLFALIFAVGCWGFRYEEKRLSKFLFPWRTLASGNPVIAAFLAGGYEFEKEWPRLVREGMDTANCQEYDLWKHVTYWWMGVLRDCGRGGRVKPDDAAALRSGRMKVVRVSPNGTFVIVRDS